ncbi:MAG: hypothetical protein QOE13_3483 [Gaiellaceae bacterium]|nr:hypothetical protein [Gaiellaceae bacterium]
MVSNEAGQALAALSAKPDRAVERMKPRRGQTGAVPDVVKVGSRDERPAILDPDDAGDRGGPLGDRLRVRPPPGRRSQRLLRLVARPVDDLHHARVRPGGVLSAQVRRRPRVQDMRRALRGSAAPVKP